MIDVLALLAVHCHCDRWVHNLPHLLSPVFFQALHCKDWMKAMDIDWCIPLYWCPVLIRQQMILSLAAATLCVRNTCKKTSSILNILSSDLLENSRVSNRWEIETNWSLLVGNEVKMAFSVDFVMNQNENETEK